MTYVKTISPHACELLIYAIINRAILDCFASPVGNQGSGFKLCEHAQSAFEFLSDSENIYFPLIDVDSGQFWHRFVSQMHTKEPIKTFTEQQREAFRINYEIWNANKIL
jgi:hypothetical protein